MPVVEYKSLIEIEVERLFREHPPVYDQYCRNPVTYAGYVGILDSTKKQKEAACRALLAREWFRFHAPREAQPLPLSEYDYHHGGEINAWRYMAWLFSRSLRCQDYDVTKHPSFAEFCRGVLWDSNQKDGDIHGSFPNDEVPPQMKKRFPPRKLEGLLPSFVWAPPEEYARTMASYRRQWERWLASRRNTESGEKIIRSATISNREKDGMARPN